MRFRPIAAILIIIFVVITAAYFSGLRIMRSEEGVAFAEDSLIVDEHSTIIALNGNEPIDPDFGNWKDFAKPRVYSLNDDDQVCYIVLHPDNAAIDCLP